MKKLILYIVQSLGARPECINIRVERGEVTTFVVKVYPEDKSLVWGENGKVFQSIKTIISAAASLPVKLKLEV